MSSRRQRERNYPHPSPVVPVPESSPRPAPPETPALSAEFISIPIVGPRMVAFDVPVYPGDNAADAHKRLCRALLSDTSGIVYGVDTMVLGQDAIQHYLRTDPRGMIRKLYFVDYLVVGSRQITRLDLGPDAMTQAQSFVWHERGVLCVVGTDRFVVPTNFIKRIDLE